MFSSVLKYFSRGEQVQPTPPIANTEWEFLNSTLQQSSLEVANSVVGWVSKLEEDESAKETRHQVQLLLEEKDKEIQNLKKELDFLYSNAVNYACNAAYPEEAYQTCEHCKSKFDYNHDAACVFHRGAIVGKTFAEQTEAVRSAFNYSHISDICPESLWRWDCCGNQIDDPGCAFRRHVPLSNEEIDLKVSQVFEQRADTLKKYFHPTDSIVLYESSIEY